MLTALEYLNCLKLVGVQNSDVVHVQSDLYKIGVVDAARNRNAVLEFYMNGLRGAIGPEGTVSVATGGGDYARFGTPFIHESTVSELGALSNYVRQCPEAVRSMHPLASVAAIGPKSHEICGGAHYDAYGYHSPWAKLHHNDALITTLGLGLNDGGLTFIHYIEKLYGVPYQYTKIYNVPVLMGEENLEGPFTMSVRYLDLNVFENVSRVKNDLFEAGVAKMLPLGDGYIWAVRASSFVDFVCDKLDKDRYYLLQDKPKFVFGKIPFDGAVIKGN